MVDRLPDVHVYERPDENLWYAANWTEQTIVIPGTTRSEAIANYIVEYNNRTSSNKTEADFRWIGPIWITCTITHNGPDWVATAHADRIYQVVRSTEEQVKTDFIEYYTTNYPHWEPEMIATDNNVHWLYE